MSNSEKSTNTQRRSSLNGGATEFVPSNHSQSGAGASAVASTGASVYTVKGNFPTEDDKVKAVEAASDALSMDDYYNKHKPHRSFEWQYEEFVETKT
ncbi:hypothetical protein L204_103329 [Cryptococcus depauperatus]|nr:hypothetical protein L204_01646 [Cryptococcus depauperatus CBS 7855]